MKYFLRNLKKEAVRGEEDYVSGMADMIIDKDDFWELKKEAKYIGVTKRFQNVMKTFPMPCGETPAGFQRDYYLDGEGILRLDLRRNISCDKNGRLRPTKVLFSADSANPYEVAPISPFLANLTCNPGIVYDLFLNNPKANVGNQFKTREEVMKELAKILGPGCDISVELNNPFEEDFQKILEEAEVFKEIFTEYRVVIKVPHTGVVTGANVPELLKDDEGGFSPERAGGLPVRPLVKLCYSGKYNEKEMQVRLKGKGGLTAYLNENDLRKVEERIDGGDKTAGLVWEAMVLQTAKDIASLAAVTFGRVDKIIFTGGMAYSQKFTEALKKRVEFVAPVSVIAGTCEMEALALGALRVLRGEEKAHIFAEIAG